MGEKNAFPITGILGPFPCREPGGEQGDCGRADVQTRPAATNLILQVSFSPVSYSRTMAPQDGLAPGSGAAGGPCTPAEAPGPGLGSAGAIGAVWGQPWVADVGASAVGGWGAVALPLQRPFGKGKGSSDGFPEGQHRSGDGMVSQRPVRRSRA